MSKSKSSENPTFVLPRDAFLAAQDVVKPYRTMLPNRQWAQLERFVYLTLPPPTPHGIAWTCRNFCRLAPVGFDELIEVANRLVTRMTAELSKLKDSPARSEKVGTGYPVAFALGRFCRSYDALARNASPSVLASFFLTTCSTAHLTKRIRPSVYYFDVISTRDSLLESFLGLGLGLADCMDVETLRTALLKNNKDLIEQIKRGEIALAATDVMPDSLPAKIKRINFLLAGIREFGSPVYTDLPRGLGGGRKGAKDCVVVQPRRIEVEQSLETLDASGNTLAADHGATVEVTQTMSMPDPSTPSHRDLGPNRVGLDLVRKMKPQGSRLAPRDDQFALRGRFNSWVAQGVPSYTDASRVPLALIFDFLNYVYQYDHALFVFAWFCVTHGIAISRLTDMEIIAGRRARLTSGVQLDRKHCLLSYELIGGPTDFNRKNKGGPSHSHIIVTPVPREFVAVLAKDGNVKPFVDADKRLNVLAARFGAHVAGPNPTAERLSRSYWIHLPANGLTEVEGAFLSGAVPSRLTAFADYHRLSRHRLHVRTVAALRQIALSLCAYPGTSKDIQLLVGSLSYPDPPKASRAGLAASDRGYVGSQVTFDIAARGAFFDHTRRSFEAYYKRLSGMFPEERFSLLVQLFNIANVQLYVLQEIALGVRPRGDVATLSYSKPEFGAWIEDKASAKYREFSLSALPSILLEQERECAQALAALQSHCRRYQVQFLDVRRRHTTQMASVYSYDPGTSTRDPAMTVATMTSSDYRQCLTELGLARFCPIRHNEFRHMMVTRFQDLPAAALTQYAGHHLPGLDMFFPWSSASARSYFTLMEEITQFLVALGPNRLPIKEVL